MTDRPRHPLDALVLDPTGLPSLYDEPTFAALLAEMVADEAPRLFAVVQEYGQRVDGQIAGWGLAFADHAEVISLDQHRWMRLSSPSQALRMFRFGSHISARLIWPTSGPVPTP